LLFIAKTPDGPFPFLRLIFLFFSSDYKRTTTLNPYLRWSPLPPDTSPPVRKPLPSLAEPLELAGCDILPPHTLSFLIIVTVLEGYVYGLLILPLCRFVAAHCRVPGHTLNYLLPCVLLSARNRGSDFLAQASSPRPSTARRIARRSYA